MSNCHCRGAETLFDAKVATKELRQYRRRGPRKTTRFLLDALEAAGVAGRTLLDIGGGVGVIQHELLRAGVTEASGVEASAAYLAAAREEAARQGHADRLRLSHGNFVELAPTLPPADVVTLDRVVCTYAHPTAAVDALVRGQGFAPRFARKTLAWQVVVYGR